MLKAGHLNIGMFTLHSSVYLTLNWSLLENERKKKFLSWSGNSEIFKKSVFIYYLDRSLSFISNDESYQRYAYPEPFSIIWEGLVSVKTSFSVWP